MLFVEFWLLDEVEYTKKEGIFFLIEAADLIALGCQPAVPYFQNRKALNSTARTYTSCAN